MKRLQNYILPLILCLLITVAILMSLASGVKFSQNAEKNASLSVSGSVLIGQEALVDMNGEVLLIRLNEPALNEDIQGFKSVDALSASLADRELTEVLRSFKGKIIIAGNTVQEAARAWTILCQLGIRNLYILNSFGEQEILKYKFRTDTVASPEL
jgi:hypothetical protein